MPWLDRLPILAPPRIQASPPLDLPPLLLLIERHDQVFDVLFDLFLLRLDRVPRQLGDFRLTGVKTSVHLDRIASHQCNQITFHFLVVLVALMARDSIKMDGCFYSRCAEVAKLAR